MNQQELELKKQSLEFEQFQKELEVRKLEVDVKEKEIAAKKRLVTPVTATIIVAIIGFAGTVITHFLQQHSSLVLEKQKFQYSIYKTAQESKDIKTAAKLLDFYIKAGLIEGKEGQFTSYLEAGEPEKIPLLETTREEVEAPTPVAGPLRIEDNYLFGDGVDYVISPNIGGSFGEGSPDMIVIHSSFTNSLEGTVGWLMSVSSLRSVHILIGRDGHVVQMVPFNRIAWHAGKSSWEGRSGLNRYSIAIMLVNDGRLIKKGERYFESSFGRREIPPKEVMLATHKFEKEPSYWQTYTKVQLSKAAEIAKLVALAYPIQIVLGHDDITGGRKRDPGPAFQDMDKFREEVLTRD